LDRAVAPLERPRDRASGALAWVMGQAGGQEGTAGWDGHMGFRRASGARRLSGSAVADKRGVAQTVQERGRASDQTTKRPTMDLGDLISPEAVFPALKVKNKKQALQELASKAAQFTGLGPREVLETLLQRERLGSTGVGRGIAIPHGRIAALTRIFSLF